jgi:hypothetical protein
LVLMLFCSIYPISFLVFKRLFNIYGIVSIHYNYRTKLSLFIISSVSFGLFHARDLNTFNDFMFITSHILFGFLLGYIRLKNGLIWSVILHSIINLISLTTIL